MKKTQIAKAIAMVCTSTALSLGSISTASADATTMYNLYNENGGVPCAPCSAGVTDGWVYGFNLDNTNPVVGWAGTAGPGVLPLGYTGGAALHWAIEMDGYGSGKISNKDSLKYGISADIDVAKGAWSDARSGGAAGWRHDLDMGLFKSNVSGVVRLSVVGVTMPGTDYGFTIMKGMDDTSTRYGHHGGWNAGNNVDGISASSLPGGGTSSFSQDDIVAYSVGGATPSNLNEISFHAEAGQVYTIVLGGYKNGAWYDTRDGYVLSIEQPSDADLVQELMDAVIALNIHHGISNALDSKLDNVFNALDDMNANDGGSAANVLYAFINSVEAQSGKKIPQEDADSLIYDAQMIIDRISM